MYMFGWTEMSVPSYTCLEIRAFTSSGRVAKWIEKAVFGPCRTEDTAVGLNEEKNTETCNSFCELYAKRIPLREEILPLAWKTPS